MVNKITANKGLSAVNKLLTQAKGTQRLKAHFYNSLNARGPDGHPKSPTYGHLKIPHPPD